MGELPRTIGVPQDCIVPRQKGSVTWRRQNREKMTRRSLAVAIHRTGLSYCLLSAAWVKEQFRDSRLDVQVPYTGTGEAEANNGHNPGHLTSSSQTHPSYQVYFNSHENTANSVEAGSASPSSPFPTRWCCAKSVRSARARCDHTQLPGARRGAGKKPKQFHFQIWVYIHGKVSAVISQLEWC